MSSSCALSGQAQALVKAYREHAPHIPGSDIGPSDAASAYGIQKEIWRAMIGSVRPTAWKVGAPERASTPLAAPVFPGRLAIGQARFPAGLFFSPSIEVEVAFRFGQELPPRARPYARAEIMDAIASAHVAMEIVDSRLADAEAAGHLWRLADHMVNGALVIGDPIVGWRELDFPGLTARVLSDGQVLAESVGQPPLDDLFHCLPWWIRHIGGVLAGDIVTTGAWNGAHRVQLPASVQVDFPGLGEARAFLE